MDWWVWSVFGLVLLAIEVATPSDFFVLFFGLAAFVVAALVSAISEVDVPVSTKSDGRMMQG